MSQKGTNAFVRHASKEEGREALLSSDSKPGTSGLAEALSDLPPESQAEFLDGLDKISNRASRWKLNTPEGEPKVKLGRWHMRLRFSFLEAVKTGGSLIIALLKLKGGDLKSVAGTALSMIQDMAKRISRLKPEELMVYEGVVDVIHTKWDKTLLVIPGASAPELDALFKKRGVALALGKIRKLLGDMSTEKRKILEVREESEGETYYVPVF
jgi:hypothetical protein